MEVTKEQQALRLEAFTKRLPTLLKIDPKVKIKLSDEQPEMTLEFNNSSVICLLQETGFNLLREPLTTEKFLDPVFVGNLMHKGLRKHQPELTLEQVNELMNYNLFYYYREQLVVAANILMPDISDVVGSETGEVADKNPM